MTDNEINKDMLDYEILSGKLNALFQFLDNYDYIFSIIPEDNKSFEKVSNKDYCAGFSCFESIYQGVHSFSEDSNQTKEEAALEEAKEELLPFLCECAEKYKGINKLKRDFIKRFINIISTANLKLEKCIINELEKNDYLIESIYYKRRDEIRANGIVKSVTKAVADRDDITHNNTVKLDVISIGIYELILKLNYVMILEYIGLPKERFAEKIKYLGRVNII